jgi:hypothetical protein
MDREEASHMSKVVTEVKSSFVDLDRKWSKRYQEQYAAKDPKAPFVSLPKKATPEGLENEIHLKANLLSDGLRFDERALAGICDVYKEQSRWLFDWNIGDHRYYLPEELLLPMDTIVQVRENTESRWLCTVEDGGLVIQYDGKTVMPARHIPRPSYYSLEASPGIIMRRIAPKRGQDCLVLNYAPFCMYWATNDGCSFCNIVPNMNWTKDDLQVSKRTYDQILKTTRAAFEEGAVRHILLTGGMLTRYKNEAGEEIDREDRLIADVMRAQQEALQRDDIPVNVIRTAPKDKDLKSIEEQKKLGAFSVAYNLEIWDPALFAKYCTGKNKVQGRDHWLRALEVAAEVYGPGRVSTHFVTGFMEPIESLEEGFEWCSERGIGVIPLIWSPVKGTKWSNFRAPRAEFFIEMAQKLADIRLKHGVDAFEPAALPNDDPMCAMPTLIADMLRLRRLQREQTNN